MKQLVNVIVSILLLALVGGPVVVVIARFRASQERSQNGCNFRSIVLAMHNHHDHLGWFPSGTWPNENLGPEKRLSWMVTLLPYIEGQSVFEKFDREKAWDAPENRPAVMQPMLTYLSDKNPNKQLPDSPALSHYVGMAGVGLDAATLPASDPRAGFFGYDRKITAKDIK